MKLHSRLAKLLAGAFEMPAPAKINWSLDIVGQRADGYHLLDSLMQPLKLSDTLYFFPSDELSLKIQGADGLAADDSNLVLRAAKALWAKTGVKKGARILLEKRIPMGAGLGGGSADAAAALRGLSEFWNLDVEEETLGEIGLTLGADVPFCLLDAPARAQGIGEILTPVRCARTFPLVLIQPCEALSTRTVFEAYRHLSVPTASTAGAMAALAEGNLRKLADSARNGMEPVTIAMRPEVEEARKELRNQGAVMAQMTGSGSVVFGAFMEKREAKRAWKALKNRYSVCILTETAL